MTILWASLGAAIGLLILGVRELLAARRGGSDG